ncbi:MAG TPA: alginate export family protein [Patescibacteria group bacterium]|nr:alginate export family protein [Patescibacteria group bacterium]
MNSLQMLKTVSVRIRHKLARGGISGLLGGVALNFSISAHAQYVPPPPPAPFAGYLNEYLREQDPSLSSFDIGGNERIRFEEHQGYGIAGLGGSPSKPNNDFRQQGADTDNSYWLSKLRLHAGYSGDWWSAFVEGRSSLVSGDKRFAYGNVPSVAGTLRKQGDSPEADGLDLQQAFISLGNPKEFPLSLKVGRQELSYGDERLVGAFGWNNIGRVFDGVKLRWQSGAFNVDAFATRPVIPQDGRFNVDNDHDNFWGIYGSTTMVPKNSLDLYFLGRNADRRAAADVPSPQFPQPSARDIYTVGGRIKSQPGQFHGFDYLVEGAYQFGDYADPRLVVNGTAPRLEHRAFMAVAQAGYTFTNVWANPRLGIEFDYGSGDSNSTNHTHETFENLFPTNHKFYGSMDLISLQNIQDAGVNLTLKPTSRISVALIGNALWLANTHDNFYTGTGAPRGGLTSTPGNAYGINPGYGSFLGTELTAIAGIAVSKSLQLEVGYGHFFTGQYVDQTWAATGFGSRDADFGYAQLAFAF